ncbi:YpzG family protein [Halalkalibacter nanhaiisediminis]|uniref:YpzG-like protein n=1 Tax=Halalkalibacter nanhaiisediminis TaxID=688079 RepID=A0A562QA36_9BACI|nr:YpzG family protein [Halalkalibacter nanhaiisediminis]TWI52886.1 YpzG-like protein [Halalkalibacter nanhaiisediminis]
MGKEKNTLQYKSPFDSPRANPKHADNQVNGETQMTQHDIVLRNNVRARRR